MMTLIFTLSRQYPVHQPISLSMVSSYRFLPRRRLFGASLTVSDPRKARAGIGEGALRQSVSLFCKIKVKEKIASPRQNMQCPESRYVFPKKCIGC